MAIGNHCRIVKSMGRLSIQSGFGIDDSPPHALAAVVGAQHLLAVFGGIITAPLLIAIGMQLGPADTAYLISSALVISGVATLIQIRRIGPIGSGMLSIQGTSFTFVTPLIVLYQLKSSSLPTELVLGQLFTACMVAALIMLVLVQWIERLRRIITPAVAGSTVILLGLSLVWVALQGLQRDYAADGPAALLAAGCAFGVVLSLALSGRPALRLCSIVVGLAAGSLVAAQLGLLQAPDFASAPTLFVPELLRYPLSFDLSLVLALLPIFIVSATESIGDLSATATLSGISVNDRQFLKRLRGGVSADTINSLLAALFSSFPNTTFSQNNGVIRLTGVASRRVGAYTAFMLILIGLVPAVALFVQALPASVVGGATVIMFALVGVSGWLMIGGRDADRRTIAISAIAVLCGPLISSVVAQWDGAPRALATFVASPVSTGAFVAMLLELLIPRFTILEPAT